MLILTLPRFCPPAVEPIVHLKPGTKVPVVYIGTPPKEPLTIWQRLMGNDPV